MASTNDVKKAFERTVEAWRKIVSQEQDSLGRNDGDPAEDDIAVEELKVASPFQRIYDAVHAVEDQQENDIPRYDDIKRGMEARWKATIGSPPTVSENVTTQALQDACRKLVQTSSSDADGQSKLAPKTMLVHVQVFHRVGSKRLAQEILFQENEYLQDLCALIAASCSNPEINTSDEKRKEEFMFVGNTFYTNKASMAQALYLRNWLELSGYVSVPRDMRVVRLESAKFSNLINLHVEVPYLYCHGTCCEHVFMIKNVQMLNPNDPGKLEADYYPKVVFQARAYRYKCMVCKDSYARFVCENCPYSGELYSFYCSQCLKGLYFDPKGGKLCATLPRSLKVREFHFH